MSSRGFEIGLDRSATLSPEEAKRLEAWYSDLHGTGDLDLVPFVTFLMKHRPDILKHHRFVAEAKNKAQHIGLLANVVLFLHYYTVVANAKGILYEIIAARKAGGTKAEIVDTIVLAYVNGAGTNGLNAVGELSSRYLEEWTDAGRAAADPWPKGWGPHTAARPAEDSAYTRLLDEQRPTVLREWRALQAAAVTALPPQMEELCRLHLAIIRRDDAAIRRSALACPALGVTRDQFVDTICWAMSYSGDAGLRAVGDTLLEIVRGWPEA